MGKHNRHHEITGVLDLESLCGELQELCRRCRVKSLDLFGSAATGRFDPKRSDLDVLVEFQDLEPAVYARAYFDLLEGLTELFGYPIDLVTRAGLRNPHLRARVDAERSRLYAA